MSHQADVMRRLLNMQCGNGLMHESISVQGGSCTRPIFEWANAMLVTLVEQTLGLDCDAEAQRLHVDMIRAREKGSHPVSSQVGAIGSSVCRHP